VRCGNTHLIEYPQRSVSSIRGGLQLKVERAGPPFGRGRRGAPTFHTLRHTAASLLAELGKPEAIRNEGMGHRDIATTQRIPISARCTKFRRTSGSPRRSDRGSHDASAFQPARSPIDTAATIVGDPLRLLGGGVGANR
jgi:Phage integrase family